VSSREKRRKKKKALDRRRREARDRLAPIAALSREGTAMPHHQHRNRYAIPICFYITVDGFHTLNARHTEYIIKSWDRLNNNELEDLETQKIWVPISPKTALELLAEAANETVEYPVAGS